MKQIGKKGLSVWIETKNHGIRVGKLILFDN